MPSSFLTEVLLAIIRICTFLKMVVNYKFVSVTFALLAVLTLCNIPSTNAQEEIECRGKDLNMTDAQKGMITDCLREAKIPSIWKIPAEKIACFGVCILEKKGLLNAAGKLDHDKIYDYIYHVMQPEEVKKPLVDGTEKCIKDHGDVVSQSGDPTCQVWFVDGQSVVFDTLEFIFRENSQHDAYGAKK